MKGKRAAQLLFRWWLGVAQQLVAYESVFLKKAEQLFHLKPDEFLSLNKEFGNDFEDLAAEILSAQGLAVASGRDQLLRGASGNAYEIDLVAHSGNRAQFPEGRYFIECKFSNPFDFSTRRRRFERESLSLSEVVGFGVKCRDILGAEKRPERTRTILITNRRIEEAALRWAHSYGVLAFGPEEPPAPALAGFLQKTLAKKSRALDYTIELLSGIETLPALNNVLTPKLPADPDVFFGTYLQLLKEHRKPLLRLLEKQR